MSSRARWLSVRLLWTNGYSDPLFILRWQICLFIVELYTNMHTLILPSPWSVRLHVVDRPQAGTEAALIRDQK